MSHTICPQRVLRQAIELLELHTASDAIDAELLENTIVELGDIANALPSKIRVCEIPNARVVALSPEQFRALLGIRVLRGASLQDVEGLHHQRPLVRHPNTGEWFVFTGATL